MNETTHERIIEVATRIFSEKGYNGTSMREIAETLEITKAALYYHFPGKEEIFMACISQSMEQLVEGLENLANKNISIWDKLDILIRGMCDFSNEGPQKFKLFKQISEHHFDTGFGMKLLQEYYLRQQSAVRSIIAKGVERGELRDDIPVNLIASAIVGMIHHTTGPKMKMMADIKYTTQDQANYLMKLIRGGFEKQ
jgi:AcrR family transcriptional regulator